MVSTSKQWPIIIVGSFTLPLPPPGVTGDCDAIRQCSLYDLVEGLPVGVCIIGDAAYQPTEHMVPVYQGADKLKAKHDDFNFYASQC
jgi:hypothetical protein